MDNESVVTSVRAYLTRLDESGIPVSFGVLFGSLAEGRGDEWSDMDLVVVSPRFDDDATEDDIRRLWRVAAATDNRIEPIACEERQWEVDKQRMILEIARRTGVRIPAPTD